MGVQPGNVLPETHIMHFTFHASEASLQLEIVLGTTSAFIHAYSKETTQRQHLPDKQFLDRLYMTLYKVPKFESLKLPKLASEVQAIKGMQIKNVYPREGNDQLTNSTDTSNKRRTQD